MNVLRKNLCRVFFSDFEDDFDDKLLKIASKKHQLLGFGSF